MRSRSINATAASLLGFLHRGPMTGWELVVTAQREIGDFWSLTRSQVYRELATMAEAALVQAGERGPRDKQPYSITDAGRDAFQAWVAQAPDEESIRFPLLLTVLFGEYVPHERMLDFLDRHRSTHAEKLERYESTLKAVHAAEGSAEVNPYHLSTLEFGVLYERAVLAWFDTLPALLRRD